ncbi:MAG: hypothetical protein L6Q76_00360 [Polyangiaceae bacterium]|nr:hypothetical protein [Zoogloea sp.]MCK6586014.1 hypothetical protein [Polyangiaceae bacterium]
MGESIRIAVERALTNHFLGTTSGFGAGPVRTIDAAPSNLSVALGQQFGPDPVTVLAEACDGPYVTARVLSDGWDARWPDAESPGFFRYLVLSCAVVALAVDADSKDFGINLAALWRCDNIFGSRAALPGLWTKLETWCRARRASGAAIREFIAPAKGRVALSRFGLGNVTHLGPTYQVAFPTWRDLSHLRTVLSRRPELLQIVQDPFEAARHLCPLIEGDKDFKLPMRLASAEYKQLYEAKATLLRLHRFWGALSQVLSEIGVRPKREPAGVPELTVRLGGGIDDAEATLCLRGVRDDANDGSGTVEGPAGLVIDGAEEWMRKRGRRFVQSSLAMALEDGAVLMLEAGFARWATSDEVAELGGRCLLLRRDGHRRDLDGAGRLLGRLSDKWSLYGPIDGLAKASLLSKLGIGARSSLEHRAGIYVRGGVKVGSAFLGKPAFLPKVFVASDGEVSLIRGDDFPPEVRLVQSAKRQFAVESLRTVSGSAAIRLEEAPVEGIDPLVAERPITFAAEAEEHSRLREPDQVRWTCVVELRVEQAATIHLGTIAPNSAESRGSAAGQMRDLAEAVYAGGAGGWSEADLVDLVGEVTGPRGPSVWDVLRGLQEAGWLSSTIATTWRVRRWWLRKPELAPVVLENAPCFVLRGSCPDALRRRFDATVRQGGGQVLAGRAAGDYCLSPLAAAGVERDKLLAELRWSCVDLPKVVRVRAPACWPVTDQEPSRHEPVARWGMSSGRFEAKTSAEDSPVELIRHRREAADRADLYTVRSGSAAEPPWVGVSRTAAILETYRRARLPMFEVRGSWLLRLPQDGYLPLPIAEAAALRTLRASGPYLDGERWTYAYPIDDKLLDEVRYLLGDAIIREVPAADGGSRHSVRMSAAEMGLVRARHGLRTHFGTRS